MAEGKPFEEVYKGLKESQADSFEPCAWYNKDGDALEIYLSTEPHITERINTLISVFVSPHDRGKVLGLVIKNIRRHFGEGGLSQVIFMVKKATVRLLLMSAMTAYELGFVRRGIQSDEAMPLDESRVKVLLEQLGSTEVDLKNTSELVGAGA